MFNCGETLKIEKILKKEKSHTMWYLVDVFSVIFWVYDYIYKIALFCWAYVEYIV